MEINTQLNSYQTTNRNSQAHVIYGHLQYIKDLRAVSGVF